MLIGIIVRNYGTIALKLWGVRVFELSSDNGRWSSKAFYYGPFSHIPPFWGRLTEVMRPPNNRSVPITLDPGRMAVIIVFINIKDKRSSYNLGIKPLFTQFNRSSK